MPVSLNRVSTWVRALMALSVLSVSALLTTLEGNARRGSTSVPPNLASMVCALMEFPTSPVSVILASLEGYVTPTLIIAGMSRVRMEARVSMVSGTSCVNVLFSLPGGSVNLIRHACLKSSAA